MTDLKRVTAVTMDPEAPIEHAMRVRVRRSALPRWLSACFPGGTSSGAPRPAPHQLAEYILRLR
jgi:hypothetical protein